MSTPRISIVIPVYNTENYLGECIESVINQTYKNIEIVLVDDGSTDNSGKICDEYLLKDSRITVIHQINQGVSAARKAGTKIAQGNYIMFVDSDDFLSLRCCEAMVESIDHNEADIVCFGLNYQKDCKYEPSPIKYRYGYYNRKDIVNEIFPSLIHKNDVTYFPPSLCGKMIKKSLLLNNLICDRLCVIGEDSASTIPCIFYTNSMIIIDECYYYYRYNRQSVTKGKKVIPWDCPKIIFNHISEHMDIKLYDFKDQLRRKLVHDIFTVAVSQFNRDDTYWHVIRDIKNNISDGIYKDAIELCCFKNSISAILMKYALKYRLFFMIFIYSRVRFAK